MANDCIDTLSGQLRDYVEKNNIPPGSLIRGAGIGCATVYAWFHGQSRPMLTTLLSIAEHLGFEVELKVRPPQKRDRVQRKAAAARPR